MSIEEKRAKAHREIEKMIEIVPELRFTVHHFTAMSTVQETDNEKALDAIIAGLEEANEAAVMAKLGENL